MAKHEPTIGLNDIAYSERSLQDSYQHMESSGESTEELLRAYVDVVIGNAYDVIDIIEARSGGVLNQAQQEFLLELPHEAHLLATRIAEEDGDGGAMDSAISILATRFSYFGANHED